MTIKVRPARDGWILLKAGETAVFSTENNIVPNDRQLHQWVTQIRGAILSSAFNLENILEVLITQFFMEETNDALVGHQVEKVELFKESVLREMNFDKKIKIASKIAKQLLKPPEHSMFAKGLGDLRTLRNLMAHYPCWLEAVKEERSDLVIAFKVFIAKDEQIYEINSQQVEAWSKVAENAVIVGENLIRRMSGLIDSNHPLDHPYTV